MKKSQNLTLALLAVVPLAVVMCGGAYFWYQSEGGADGGGAGDVPAVAVPPAAPRFAYLEMPDLKIPAAQGGHGQVDLKISLEVYAGEKDAVAGLQTRLMDALVSDLYVYLGEGNMIVPGRVENLDKVKARLLATVEKTLGPGKVHDILIQPVSRLWESTSPAKKKEKEDE